MKRLSLLIAIALIVIMSMHAQIITWAVKPGIYSKIEPCWEDLYFVNKGSNIGIINGDGRVVVSPEASRITGFYGGLALVLKSDGGKERILGILSVDGSYSKIDGIYYTIPYQEFFSEGLLTVTNPRGQASYMNANGVIVKSFNVSFISPFSEGYAVVGENENYSIVDKRFNTLSIQLGSVSQVYGGSNIYKGMAVIWDGNGKFYNFDVNRGTCTKTSKPSSLDYDYMYCFSCISKRSGNVPYEQPTRLPQGMAATSQGDKYGYVNNEKTILPCQFDHAESFYGTHAIVETNGKYGLLSLHNTNTHFEAKVLSEIKYKKSSSKNLTHKFDIIVPPLWDLDNINVRVKDENGSLVNITKNGGTCEFKTDGASGTKKYKIEIDSEGLVLWNSEIAFNYIVEAEPIIVTEPTDRPMGHFKPFKVTLKAANTQADKNNRCYVIATIFNPNSEAITATVTIAGSNLLEAVSQKVTIQAYGSKDISTYFIVKKATSGQKVTVSTSAGGSATLDGLQLIPF